MPRHFSAFVLLAIVTAAADVHAADKTIRLEIPDTGQESRRPESGWCGEAAIQMAMSHYGIYASQQTINRAGEPAHPDLYAHEVLIAMRKLGLAFKTWRGDGMPAFLRWIRDELAAGHPVLLGVKIYPTAHPEWGLDHFVLAVGSNKQSLTLNTTWKRQETRSLALLSSREKGLSFANGSGRYYGLAITGFTGQSDADGRPTRIKIDKLLDKEVEFHIIVEDLKPGKHYRLVKFNDLSAARKPEAQGKLVRAFVAETPKLDLVEKIGIDEIRLYRCLPSSD
jgi:hypothetical protein